MMRFMNRHLWYPTRRSLLPLTEGEKVKLDETLKNSRIILKGAVSTAPKDA